MLNQLKGTGLALACCLSLFSVSSLAYTRCSTQSSGQNFVDGDFDFNTARGHVINDCTSNGSTDNGQCRARVRCDGDTYDPNIWISCTTRSSGLQFEDGSSDVMDAANKAINNCTGNGSTSNGSCRANVECVSTAGASYAPFVRCTTESSGIRFEDGNVDGNQAAQLVINDCTSSGSTDNGQCRANVDCSGN